MNNLALVNTNDFNGISCNVYADGNKIFMTRTQIGEALGYDNPKNSIKNIHTRHTDRLDRFSRRVQIELPSGGSQDTYFYSQRGIMEICRWSRQPLADQFMDWVWDIIDAYRDGTLAGQQVNNTALSIEAVETMVDNRIGYITKSLTDEIQLLKDELKTLKRPALPHPTNMTPTPTYDLRNKYMSAEDIAKNAIAMLAVMYGDHSLGYNCTYRRVYDEMGVSWKHRLGRYRNAHKNKNNPSKFKLVLADPKLMKLFLDTVKRLKEEQEQSVTE